MIAEERLKETIDLLKNSLELPEEYESYPQVREQLEIYQEILSLRSQKQRLIEDGERMALILSDGDGKADELCIVDYFHARDAVYEHTTLLKELEE